MTFKLTIQLEVNTSRGGWDFTKLMLNSTLVEVGVEVEVDNTRKQAGADLCEAQVKLLV